MLIEVLLLHRQLPAAALAAGMETVLRVGSVSTDLVAIEARKHLESCEEAGDQEPATDTTSGEGGEAEADGWEDSSGGAKVICPHTRRLPPDPRSSLPDMTKYDRLLAPVKRATTKDTTA